MHATWGGDGPAVQLYEPRRHPPGRPGRRQVALDAGAKDAAVKLHAEIRDAATDALVGQANGSLQAPAGKRGQTVLKLNWTDKEGKIAPVHRQTQPMISAAPSGAHWVSRDKKVLTLAVTDAATGRASCLTHTWRSRPALMDITSRPAGSGPLRSSPTCIPPTAS